MAGKKTLTSGGPTSGRPDPAPKMGADLCRRAQGGEVGRSNYLCFMATLCM